MNVILGAGPAGLFCAHQLKVQGSSAAIVEKEDYSGGLAASHDLDGLKYEIGPHIFSGEDSYILEIVQGYLKNDLLERDWAVLQYLDKELLLFPNNLADMFRKLGIGKLSGFLISFIMCQTLKPINFRYYIYKKVGRALAEFNVLNYTEKMWGVQVDDLEIEWIKPRLERISLKKILGTLYTVNKRSFYYPRFGAGQLYDVMAKNREIHYRNWPQEIHHQDNKITFLDTNKTRFQIDNLISSIPLYELLIKFNPLPPDYVLKAAANLRYRSQIYVILLMEEEPTINCQWIYFPEKEIPFCRVHFPSAFSDQKKENSKSLAVFEYFCFDSDPIWERNRDLIILETIDGFRAIPEFSDIKVEKAEVIRKKYAYPLMSRNRKPSLNIVNQYLTEFQNLHLIGRHGLHTYDNQHEAARTGVDIANLILS